MKNSGPKSKKVQRRKRAQERALAYAQLSPAQKEQQKATNKANYELVRTNRLEVSA